MVKTEELYFALNNGHFLKFSIGEDRNIDFTFYDENLNILDSRGFYVEIEEDTDEDDELVLYEVNYFLYVIRKDGEIIDGDSFAWENIKSFIEVAECLLRHYYYFDLDFEILAKNEWESIIESHPGIY